jgi:hypothetical protein
MITETIITQVLTPILAALLLWVLYLVRKKCMGGNLFTPNSSQMSTPEVLRRAAAQLGSNQK